MSDIAPQRLRADAARNRRALLDATEKALARKGADVSVAAIADAAGLGKATVFRRFPTKEALVVAVVEDRIGQLVARGEALAGREDAPAALHEFLAVGAEMLAGNYGICEAVYGLTNLSEIQALTARMLDVAGVLLQAAQAEGRVRADVTSDDLVLLLRGIAQTAQPLHAASPELWRRYLDLAWDGLRAGTGVSDRLSGPPPVLRGAQGSRG
ncbi:TetR/AcrR family transcriptional regulator [Microbacterium sp.]|uniref:TetR/AcrR family transcriptional regulator n=1 Tax=Microbacterium sp. TaxID=51671 RepID=UPI001ACCA883|nr:TetR/AcrR family transcriptional regulator [Microbacterium sp.]MBN9152136.1 helix-turn-helix transcriptional regulator [Micrococcales bacterium]MBN9155443.1 helix-turn-helix transcriptional regulator [Microbacterium sp.]MBN9191875.1 helix-turn-helix transcriptional regulator [Microbacterium sp.]MBN9608131.1 helix-turn-helix transcriptional regulator [Actinomycetota bacterium]